MLSVASKAEISELFARSSNSSMDVRPSLRDSGGAKSLGFRGLEFRFQGLYYKGSSLGFSSLGFSGRV